MSTTMSHNGSIRYPYYRCRSSAGGRLPCIGVNVHSYEIESLLRKVLGQPLASDPEDVLAIAASWNRLDEASQRRLLPQILSRAIWHHKNREITLDLIDEASQLLDDEIECHGDEDLG